MQARFRVGENLEITSKSYLSLSEKDVIGDGLKIYHADRIIRETGKEFNDGTHIIYVNGTYKGEKGKPLDDLIHDFFCANPHDMRHRQLAKRVEFFRDNNIGVSSMSSIIAEFFKDEIAEAEKKKLLEHIRSLMKKLNLTAQQAMDILEVPANEQKKYIPLI